MAGYDYTRGMSNNAVTAYRSGLVPASKIDGVPAKLVREHCDAAEWHHSSKMYNCVNFYDRDEVRELFGLIEGREGDPVCVAALAAYRRKQVTEEYFGGCHVEWVTFSKRRRRGWDAHEHEVRGVNVRIRGQMVDVMLPSGELMTKKLTGNHFDLKKGKPITARAWAMRLKRATNPAARKPA